MTEDSLVRNLVFVLMGAFLLCGGWVALKFYQAKSARTTCIFQCKNLIADINQVSVARNTLLEPGVTKTLDSRNKVTIEIKEGECVEYEVKFQDQTCEPVK